jgi:hypothetical protein
MEQVTTQNEYRENLQETIKGSLTLSFIIGTLLYLSCRVLFNDFETTVMDELVLYSTLLLGSICVVLFTAVFITLLKEAGNYIERRKKARSMLHND